MTENDAIKCLRKQIEVQPCGNVALAFEKAIKALEEIQQYRAIGAVEDVQEIFSLCKTLQEIVKKYSAIGTIEEFKALKENQRKCEECAGCTAWMCDCANIKNKAIDEFAEKMKEIYKGITFAELFIDEIAEQLKGGGKDE